MVVVIYDEMTIVTFNPTWCTVAADIQGLVVILFDYPVLNQQAVS